jgi:Cdc6-like AAA superfamily ATPase
LHITTNIKLDDRRRRVLDFFMTTNPQQSLTQSLAMRHPQTGFWLVDGDEFQEWLSSGSRNFKSNRLWLSGIPGAGKTVLAGVVISEVLALSSISTGIAFFFCQYKATATQQPINIISTFTAQLAKQNQDAYALLEDYYDELQPEEGKLRLFS